MNTPIAKFRLPMGKSYVSPACSVMRAWAMNWRANDLFCNTARAESVDGNSVSRHAPARQSSLSGNEPALGERPLNPGRALEVAGLEGAA
jgi:hypothetical protein